MEPQIKALPKNESQGDCTIKPIQAWEPHQELSKHSTNLNQSSREPEGARQAWDTFVENCTLHGLYYVVHSRTAARKSIWGIFVLAGIAWFVYQSSMLLTKFFSYPVATTATLEYEHRPLFPAVTICNFNTFRNSAAVHRGYFKILQGFNSEYFNVRMTSNHSSGLERFNLTGFNMTAAYVEAGHQIKDMLLTCYWNGGEQCTAENFSQVLTPMGLCHTFNSGRNKQPILRVKEAGSAMGLNLVLNIEQGEYFGVLSRQAGIKVYVHEQQTFPLVGTFGFAVGPGSSAFAAVRKNKVQNLPYPYGTKCFAEDETNIPGYTKYTASTCLFVCRSKFVIERCGCRGVGMPALNDAPLCNPKQCASCLWIEIDNFNKQNHSCDCPVPCHSVAYDTMLSYGYFPTFSFLKSIAKIVPIDKRSQNKDLQDHEHFRENVLELHVYFPELNYHLVRQEPAYHLENLLGEIGGQLGLCVGASLLTVLEFLDVFLKVWNRRQGPR